MDMDIDEEFDDFELGTEDLLILQQEEEIYQSSQQSRTNNSQQLWVPPIQEVSNNSTALLEAERTIEELRFKVQRLEIAQANRESQLDPNEFEQLKNMLKEKDNNISNLKRELAMLKHQNVTGTKRLFPGEGAESQKSKPSPFSTPQMSFQPSQIIKKEEPTTIKLSDMASSMKISSPVTVTKKLVKKSIPNGTQTGLTESERNNKLLIVLFEPLFQKWNRQHHNNKKNIEVCLKRTNIRYFSEQFSQQFVPQKNLCKSTEHYNNLLLLSSDISSYIMKSEYADGTIRLLLNVFNLCLPICIKEKLFKVIQNIITVITRLASCFSIATKYLYKDLTFDTNSILIQFTNCFSLFSFDLQGKNLILSEMPDIEKKSMTEILNYCKLYSIKPNEILNQLKQKDTPEEAFQIVLDILKLFHFIGSQDEKPIFDFLIEDKNFSSFLYPNQPYKLIIHALSVLETNFIGDSCMKSYKDNHFTIITCLSNLIIKPQGSWDFDNWYRIRFSAMKILYQITLDQLPSKMINDIFKIIIQNTNQLLTNVALDFNEHRPNASEKIRKQYDSLMRLGLKIMYSVIINHPDNIFKHINEPRPDSVLGYVPFFKSKGIDETLLENRVLSDLTDILEPLLTKSKSTQNKRQFFRP